MFGLAQDLQEKVENKMAFFLKVLKQSLKVKKESITIICDYGYPGKELAMMFGIGYYLAAKSKGYQAQLLFQGPKKGFMHAEDHVVRALEMLPKNNVIIVTVSNKLGRFGKHKSFRGFCKERGHRFISSTGLGDAKSGHFDLFLESMSVNYSRIKKRSLIIKKILDKGKEIVLKTDAGTDLVFDISGMIAIANVGLYHNPGEGGNIPAGEVYIPPRGYRGVNGTLVIDGSMKTDQGTFLLDNPVTLDIKNGKIVSITGKYAHMLESALIVHEERAKFPYRVRYIGEFGVGTNPGAVLLGSTIIDEKVLGTAHVAIGSNSWFGGAIKTVFHADQVIKNPRIYVDGKKINV